MPQVTQANDDLVMDLMDQALALPLAERDAFLRSECQADSDLIDQVANYIYWKERMGGFLLDPLFVPQEENPPFEPGQLLINRFRVEREIARGGMGIVWEAFDEKLGRRVAIKSAKTGFGKQLSPEVRNARDVSHPNVCKIFEIHTTPTPAGEIDFISMEFVQGETLSERLHRGPLYKREALNVARQLCAGLAEAHRNNIVHGDLKSNNVILTRGPDSSIRAVLMDFGLARRPSSSGSNPSAEPTLGTPAYMAPELWKGVKPSVSSDIYALGIVLWEIVSGRRPTDLGATSATLSWEDRPAWKPPKGFGKWDRILARCLEADPTRRYQSADQLATAIAPVRKRWLLTAFIAAILAAASGVITFQRSTAPAETVQLALLPIPSDPQDSALAETLFRNTTNQIAQIKSSQKTKFAFISQDNLRDRVDNMDKAHTVLGATHVLRVFLDRQPDQAIKIRAYLTDVRSGADATEWDAIYQPAELKYTPVALAGVITEALHLPIAEIPKVNAAAQTDYTQGLSDVSRDSSVEKALAHFENAVTADPDSPLTFAALAEAQRYRYDFTRDNAWITRATESIRQAQRRNPDLPQVHRVAGLLKASIGQYDLAISDFLRAIDLDPTSGDAFRWLGQAYVSNNQIEPALGALRKAAEVDPRQYRNQRSMGVFYYNRGDYSAAASCFHKAIDLAPNEPTTHYYLGMALMYAGQFRASESELRLSIHLHETTIALHNLGVVLLYEQREKDSIAVIQRALQLGPEQSVWWMNLGTAYRRLGSKRDAERAYRRGLKLAEPEMIQNPRKGNIRAHLAYLCAQLGDQRRAESEIAQALQMSPNDADTRFMAALTYEALHRRDDVLSQLGTSPRDVIADVGRWPDVADLHKDSRFIKLLAIRSVK